MKNLGGGFFTGLEEKRVGQKAGSRTVPSSYLPGRGDDNAVGKQLCCCGRSYTEVQYSFYILITRFL